MVLDSVLAALNPSGLWQAFLAFLPRFTAGLLVFIAFYLIYQATVLIVRGAMERRKVHASIINLTVKTYKYILIVTGLLLALHQMGVQLGAALTGLGVAGVALGFAAKDTVSNYIAGITIFWDKPFYVGDYISVDDRYGRVTEITMRSTRIRTLQNQYLIVPNQQIVDALVVNHSKNGELRIEIPVSIRYADNIARARSVLLSIADSERDARISQYLRPTVVVTQLGDNGVHLVLRIWINKAEDERAVYHEYLEHAKHALEQHGMVVPFPQRTLHVHEADAHTSDHPRPGDQHHQDMFHQPQDTQEEEWHEKQPTAPLQRSH